MRNKCSKNCTKNIPILRDIETKKKLKTKEKLAIMPRRGVLKVTSDTVGEVILISKNGDKKQ